MKTKIAILASGEGTTAEAFIRSCVAGQVAAEIVLVICNKPEAGVIERVRKLNQELGLLVEIISINSQTHPATPGETVVRGGQTKAEEQAICDALESRGIELSLSMGYLRRIGPLLVHEFGWRKDYTSPYQARMLNTHPGLLPETKGLWGIHVQEHVIAQKLPFGGQTLHVVAEDYDDGPTIAEHKLAVNPTDDAESFFERVKTMEKAALPSDIQTFILGRENYLMNGNSGS